jgi:hypothetical protein
MDGVDVKVGDFTVGDLLGRGSTGEVWSAVDPHGRPAAVKVLPGAASLERQQTFRREVAGMARLWHPAVLQLLDAGVVEREGGRFPAGTPWLALERADGSLADHVPCTFEELVSALEQVLDGLAHAHARGLVHRDLKAPNVLRVAGAWKLADFGITHTLGAERATLAGTPSTMAPEQWSREAHALGPWTDLYALGATTWHLVRGAPLFTGSVSEVREQHERRTPGALTPRFALPEGFEPWLRWLLEKAPTDRPACAAEALDALRRVTADPRATAPVVVSARDWRAAAQRGAVTPGLFGLRAWPPSGRSDLQDRLWSLLQQVVSTGVSEAVVLQGPPGAGASSLADWLATRADELGLARPLRARHHAPATPRDGAAGLFRRALRLEGRTPDDGAAEIRRLLPRSGAELVGLVYPDVGEPPAPGRRADVTLAALRELAAEGPLVLVLDDVHLDPDGPALLRRLQRARVAVLAVGTAPPTFDATWFPTLPVPPLGAAAAEVFLTQVVGLAPHTARSLAARSGGLPGVAIAVVAGWIHRGVVRDGPTGREGPDDDEIGAAALVAAALRHVPAEAQRGLEFAALLGTDVDDAEWRPLVREADVAVTQRAVDALEDARLAARTRDGLRFARDEVRDAVLARSRAAGRYEQLRQVVFHHLEHLREEADDEERFVVSASLTARALPLAGTEPERVHTAASHVNALRRIGRADEAALEGARWLAVATPGSRDEAVLTGNIANADFELGRWPAARAGWALAIQRHEAIGRVRSVRLNRRNLAILDRLEGDLLASEQALAELVTVAEAEGDQAGAARTRVQLARTVLERSQREDGAHATRARLLLEAGYASAVGLTRSQAHSDLVSVWLDQTGDLDAAVTAFTEAIAAYEEAGLVRAAGMQAISVVQVAAGFGRVAQARAWFDTWAPVVDNGGALARTAVAGAAAWLAFCEGRHAEVAALATDAARSAAALGVAAELMELALLRGRAAALLGHADEAQAAFAEARARATARGWGLAVAEVAAAEALAATASCREDAAEVRARATGLADAAHAPPFSAARRWLRAAGG